tara:strand:+ start:501 stop:887 length:387 start_codon:yes stop_codon:yes gene_type:complete
MDLTFTVQKIKTEGENKAVQVIYYTVSGTDDDGASASLQRITGFKLKDGTEDGYVAFEDVTQATAVAWVKSALTPIHLANSYIETDADGNEEMKGTADGVDLWPGVKLGIEMDIKAAIAKAATNLPWS